MTPLPFHARRVADLPPGVTAVLEVDRPVTRQQAEAIRDVFGRATGCACVILSKGTRLAAVIADDPGTPIFDRLLDERRKPGAPANPLYVFDVIAPR